MGSGLGNFPRTQQKLLNKRKQKQKTKERKTCKTKSKTKHKTKTEETLKQNKTPQCAMEEDNNRGTRDLAGGHLSSNMYYFIYTSYPSYVFILLFKYMYIF